METEKIMLVGGSAHGRVVSAPSGPPYHIVAKSRPVSAMPRKPENAPTKAMDDHEKYRRRVFHFADGSTIEFMAPEAMTDREVFEYLFERAVNG